MEIPCPECEDGYLLPYGTEHDDEDNMWITIFKCDSCGFIEKT